VWRGTAELVVRDDRGRVVQRAQGTNTVTNFGFWMAFAALGNTGCMAAILNSNGWGSTGGQTSVRWLGSNGTAPDWFDGTSYYRPVNGWAFLYLSTDTTAPNVATNTLPGGSLIAAAAAAGNGTYSWPFNGANQSLNTVAAASVTQLSFTQILATAVLVPSQNPTTLTIGSVGFSPGIFPNTTEGANVTTINWAANLLTNSSSPASTAGLVIASKLIPSSPVTVAQNQQLTVNYTLTFTA